MQNYNTCHCTLNKIKIGTPILYFIVYITVCRGWGGVVVMYTIENQHLHLGGGASEKEDSASPREDKILPRTCISFFHT